jgi:CelD/BcsL family acetyltransferase involved in cellulose biosynthesis
VNDWSLCYYIRLSDSRMDYINSLSRNVRKNLNKRMRRLNDNYKVEFKTQDDFDSIRDAMELFFNLHGKRWKSKGHEGAFANEDNRAFQISLAETFNEKGWLALYFLTVDDEPISAACTFDYNLKKYGYLTGFDPEFSQFGVGNLLKMHIIDECFRKRFREYDFGRGSESYKTEWATGVRKNLSVGMANGGCRVPLLLWINDFKNKYLHT